MTIEGYIIVYLFCVYLSLCRCSVVFGSMGDVYCLFLSGRFSLRKVVVMLLLIVYRLLGASRICSICV